MTYVCARVWRSEDNLGYWLLLATLLETKSLSLEAVSLCSLVGLELATSARLACNLQRSACLCFPKAVYCHTYLPHPLSFLFVSSALCTPGQLASQLPGSLLPLPPILL